jgi:hypothetical protein
MAEDLSTVLREALPVENSLVDRYRGVAVWDQAIIESLATFVNERTPLPSDVRRMVQDLIDEPGVSPKLRKGVLYQLSRILA